MTRFEEFKERKIANERLVGDAKTEDMEDYFATRTVDLHTVDQNRHDHVFDYDAPQLKEYLENRFSDKSDFAMRTEYYFRNFSGVNRKTIQYLKLSGNEHNAIDVHAARYPRFMRSANKRKSSARTAAAEYHTMYSKIVDAQNDDNNPNLTSVNKYAHKEEIMKCRLRAMKAVAEVKSKSSSHEKYLKARAELSCYLALKDQLDHYIENEQNQRLRDTLTRKHRTLTSNINSAYKTLKKVTPTVLDRWRDENNINDQAIAEKRDLCRRPDDGYPDMTTDSAKLLLNLEKIEYENSANAWPKQLVISDSNNICINKVEEKAFSWNNQYTDAKDEFNPQPNTTRKMDIEAYERFKKMHVPTPQELRGKGTYKYVYNNLRDYYEIFHKALPYYRSDAVPQYVRDLMNKDPKVSLKISYLKQVQEYILFRLRKDHHIMTNQNNSYIVEPQNQRLQYARNADNEQFRNLTHAYELMMHPAHINIQDINANIQNRMANQRNDIDNGSVSSSIRIDNASQEVSFDLEENLMEQPNQVHKIRQYETDSELDDSLDAEYNAMLEEKRKNGNKKDEDSDPLIVNLNKSKDEISVDDEEDEKEDVKEDDKKVSDSDSEDD